MCFFLRPNDCRARTCHREQNTKKHALLKMAVVVFVIHDLCAANATHPLNSINVIWPPSGLATCLTRITWVRPSIQQDFMSIDASAWNAPATKTPLPLESSIMIRGRRIQHNRHIYANLRSLELFEFFLCVHILFVRIIWVWTPSRLHLAGMYTK